MKILRIGLLLFLGMASKVRAEGAGAPDFYLITDFAMMTYKSKLIANNDTATGLRYGFGNSAGSEGQLQFQLMTDSATTSFALNESKIAWNWQDTSIRYRWNWFYLGGLFSRVDMKVTNAGTETIDAAGSGMGAITGISFPLGKRGQFFLNVASVQISTMKDALGQTISIGSRLDTDIGAEIDLSKRFLLDFGYRLRSLTVKTDASYAESIYSTYAGFKFSLSF